MNNTAAGEKDSRRGSLFLKQFNWRMLLVRVLINGLSLITITALLPDIYFVDPSLVRLLFLAAILGLLNAFVKPVLQFLTLAFIFATYGLVIVLINTVILLLLSRLFPGLFAVERLLWALVGGAAMGILSGALESLFGLNLPIAAQDDRRLADAARPAPQRLPALMGSDAPEGDGQTENPAIEAGNQPVLATGDPPGVEVPATASGAREGRPHEESVRAGNGPRAVNLPGDEEQ